MNLVESLIVLIKFLWTRHSDELMADVGVGNQVITVKFEIVNVREMTEEDRDENSYQAIEQDQDGLDSWPGSSEDGRSSKPDIWPDPEGPMWEDEPD